MRLSEMFDETPQYVLVGKLMKQGHDVELSVLEYQRDFTRWHNGKIIDIVHATGPNTNNFLVWYERTLASHGISKTIKDSVRIQHAQFARLHLIKINGKWTLTDRKPEPDDEA